MIRVEIYSPIKVTKKSLLAVLMISFFLGSCNKVLELQPLDAFSDGVVFKDPATLSLFINGTYIGIRNPFDDTYGLTEGMTDNSYSKYSGAHQTFTNGEMTRDNGEDMTRSLWSNGYSTIRRVNLFMEQAAASPIDTATLNRLTAEMRFIRAFKYAELLKYYGGVPIITSTFALDAKTFDVSRNTIEEVTAFIVKECDEVAAVLPGFADTDKGKATREAAMALKARTLLYFASPLYNPSGDMARWTVARDANKAVMDLPGFPMLDQGSAVEYNNTFSGKDQSEIIFARYFSPTNPQSGNNGINQWLFPNGFDSFSGNVPTQDILDNYEMSNGKLPAEDGSGYDPQNPYVNREPRFYANFLFNTELFYDPYSAKAVRPLEYYRDKADPANADLNGRESRGAKFNPSGGSSTGYNFRKYTVEGLGAYNFGANRQTNPWIYFRMSEFYLNYAECQIALGMEEEARAAISRIRRKVGLPAVTETGAALYTRYQRERRIELMLEDHRLQDIRRWKVGPQALNKPVMGVDIYKSGTTMEYIYNYIVDANRKWDDKMYWFPIPYGEIQRSNGKLEQNPGY